LLEVAEVNTVDELLIVFNNLPTLARGGYHNWISCCRVQHVSCEVRRGFVLSWCWRFTEVPALQVADLTGIWFHLYFVMCVLIGLKDKQTVKREFSMIPV